MNRGHVWLVLERTDVDIFTELPQCLRSMEFDFLGDWLWLVTRPHIREAYLLNPFPHFLFSIVIVNKN